MAKRIPLSENSFLGHVFSPKKNPVPSGIRKTSLVGLKGGRTKARLNAFNRMSPVNQEILKRSGQRDAYLRGEATLADAKRSLRPKAIALKLAKPLRTKAYQPAGGSLTGLDRTIADRLKSVVREAGKDVNSRNVDQRMKQLKSPTRDMTKWSYSQFAHAARAPEYTTEDDEGNAFNPFWYR